MIFNKHLNDMHDIQIRPIKFKITFDLLVQYLANYCTDNTRYICGKYKGRLGNIKKGKVVIILIDIYKITFRHSYQ